MTINLNQVLINLHFVLIQMLLRFSSFHQQNRGFSFPPSLNSIRYNVGDESELTSVHVNTKPPSGARCSMRALVASATVLHKQETPPKSAPKDYRPQDNSPILSHQPRHRRPVR